MLRVIGYVEGLGRMIKFKVYQKTINTHFGFLENKILCAGHGSLGGSGTACVSFRSGMGGLTRLSIREHLSGLRERGGALAISTVGSIRGRDVFVVFSVGVFVVFSVGGEEATS